MPKVSFELISPEIDYCLVFTENSKFQKLVINSQEEYQKLQSDLQEKQSIGCQKLIFPSIDFASKTLLGAYTEGSCGARFERDLRRDDGSKVYKYFIDTKTSFCVSGPSRRSLNLISVQKIPQDYQVIVEWQHPASTGEVEFRGFTDCFDEQELKLLRERNIDIRGDPKICPQ